MSIRPNRYGPFSPLGELTVTAAGTGVNLSTNFEAGFKYNPNSVVTAAEPQQYAVAFEDMIINSPPNNSGGLYLINDVNGSKADVDKILLYIPKDSGPINLKKYLGGARINPNSLCLDADQDGDKAWLVGIIGT